MMAAKHRAEESSAIDQGHQARTKSYAQRRPLKTKLIYQDTNTLKIFLNILVLCWALKCKYFKISLI